MTGPAPLTKSNQLIRNCPVCNGTASRAWLRPAASPGPLVRCQTCGFVFVNPIETTRSLVQAGPVLGTYPARLLESANCDDIKGSWEAPLLETYQSEFPAKRLNAQDALLRLAAHTQARGRLLDVGCGAGLFLSVAAQEGWDASGIEPLVMHAIFARGTFGVNVKTDTLADDTYPADFFDVITAFQVFEHLIHPDAELEKIRRILKPQGHVLIEVPNIETLGVRVLGARHRHFVQDHVSFFSAKTLRNFLERRGFQVQEIYYPTRVMSLRHLNSWLERSGGVGKTMRRALPRNGQDKFIRLNLGDIVAVIAKKV